MRDRPKDSNGNLLYISDLCKVLEPIEGVKEFVKDEDGDVLLVTIQSIHSSETASPQGRILVTPMSGLQDSRLIKSNRLVQEDSVFASFTRIIGYEKMEEKLANLPKLVSEANTKKPKKKKKTKKEESDDQLELLKKIIKCRE